MHVVKPLQQREQAQRVINIQHAWRDGDRKENHKSRTQGARDNNEKAVVVSYMPYSGCVREFDIFIMRPNGTQNQLIRTSGVGTLNKDLTFSLIPATAYLKEGFD